MITRLLGLLMAACLLVTTALAPVPAVAADVPVKSLGRFEGWRDNVLVGFGVVVGLAGTGDSPRNQVTRQAMQNVFSRLGATVSEQDIHARNVAVVVVTATLPASANVGDRIPVMVSSAGDARSLAGGVLLMTPLQGPDARTYALAQGALIAGGFAVEFQGNLQQRNMPTTARVENGATVEVPVNARLLRADGTVGFLLYDPSFQTADTIASEINRRLGGGTAWAVSADEVRIRYSGVPEALTGFIGELGNLMVAPDRMPRVVINERTGTVVAGADVRIAPVVIAQGDLRISIETRNEVSQPGLFVGPASGLATTPFSNSTVTVTQGADDVVLSLPGTTVADLVQALAMARVDTRRIIAILQAVRAAGALNAEIVIQ